MNLERITQPILNLAKYGRFLLSLETVEPGQQMASITHYGTKEAPSVSSVEEILQTCPDYSKQLAFHEQELADADRRGFPPGQIQYHRQKVAVLGGLVLKEVA